MTAWLAMIVASVAMTSKGIVSDGRDHVEERIVDEFGVLDQHRRLAHVIEHQRGHDDVQPGRR